MAYICYFSALIGNFLACFRKRQSLFILLLTLCVILLLWVGNTEGPDIANYHIHFATSGERIFKYGFYQILYNYPIYLFREWGFSFYQYRFWATLVSWILILGALNKLKTNIHLVLFAYLFVGFFMEGIQMRNFFALPFLLLGIVILVKKIPFWRIWFLVMVGLAASIHSSFIVYVIFALIPTNGKIQNKILWLYALGALGTITFFLLFRNQLQVLINLLISFDEVRGLHYTQKSTRLGILVPVFLQAFAIFIITFIKVKLISYTNKKELDEEIKQDIQTVSTILWIDVFATYLISFCILEITFYRLIRNLLLVNWLAIGIGSKYLRKNICFWLFATGYLVAWIFAEFVIWNDWYNILPYFFTYNLYL